MRNLRGIATAALCAAVAIGCSGTSPDASQGSGPTDAAAPAEVRHDIAGLVEVFPGVGAPESVAWLQWGEPADGGMAVRWTDAVVRLNPAVADAMAAQFEPTDTGRRPQVQDALSAEIPAGPFLTGELLDAGFSSDSTSTYAFLDRGQATLVLQATSIG
ncbi:hypothetical protein [Mycolicibacterium diernhoferi]|uniref:Uncharacterized protein n=1 Tax=Mycolicibacterium diernhoferi TaxID=1801 RepID=A0A1Q4HA99_9MYCO|nr:hypothetical protein [Mycolicibacterium diernhoferi]OJZ64385.1 hypothetical protein BRW64_18090 [Mycolicibacterium diernhoferi]OPE53470.1 hypothetical protein BV510_15375 [Mycolicibacterium diernhoferi]PEG53416.1 hypothetical protein CRI78_16250 [Mycolicibacterium diernhoferi]QYL24201.1 hypothetical protein K0O62_08025 [Mycolicibacterium diernhoferi]